MPPRAIEVKPACKLIRVSEHYTAGCNITRLLMAGNSLALSKYGMEECTYAALCYLVATTVVLALLQMDSVLPRQCSTASPYI